MKRREFLKTAASGSLAASFAEGAEANPARTDVRLFPTDLPGPDWLTFPAAGFSHPACGVIYRLKDKVTNGLALGGIDTGCLDLETSGLLGYCTLFNTHVPRRGPLNVPILGLSVGGKTWALCDRQPKRGSGGSQVDKENRNRIQADSPELNLDGVETAREIHYWGHYPVADLEFETSAPISVGLRAFVPFLPGDVVGSMLPGAVFEVHLRNTSRERQNATLAFSFPGPLDKEAGSAEYARKQERAGAFHGVVVEGPLAGYALGVIGAEQARFGGPLSGSGSAWAAISQRLPTAGTGESGASCAVDVTLAAGQSQVVRFALTWNAPTWNAGGYNWAQAAHTFTHMYAKHYPSALAAAEQLARSHASLLRRILAWQQAVYTATELPVWLRESLVNNLYLITEDGLWAQKKPPLPDWVREEDGLFGMIERPRGCPQIECIPCSFYGNQPLVYFFPGLALSTYRGYEGYQFADGAPPWIFGGCTGSTPPIDFANTTRGYQFATNGISLAAMLDRYYLCYGDKEKEFVKEFHPVLKKAMNWTVNLRPEYPLGERVIAMPTGNAGTEWFEAPEPGWAGMTYMYAGQRAFGLELARKVWHNLICLQGYTWDMPNIMRGDVDTGERVFGNDYYQDMMLWSLPAAIDGKDFGAPTKPGGLVDRMLKACNGSGR